MVQPFISRRIRDYKGLGDKIKEQKYVKVGIFRAFQARYKRSTIKYSQSFVDRLGKSIFRFSYITGIMSYSKEMDVDCTNISYLFVLIKSKTESIWHCIWLSTLQLLLISSSWFSPSSLSSWRIMCLSISCQIKL